MKYFVSIGERVVEVEIDGERIAVDGSVVQASLAKVGESPELRLTIDGMVSTLALDGYADGRWRLVDRGMVHEIEAIDERARHIRSLSGAGRAAGGVSGIKAPMPGLVARIVVAPGDTVVPGQALIVLEAMKMENELKATAPGVVASIAVTVGQAVTKGQMLVHLSEASDA